MTKYEPGAQQLLIRFGAVVREARLGVGLSQEELGERAGLHRTYVGAVERGERNVSLINIHAIAGALGLPVRDIVDC